MAQFQGGCLCGVVRYEVAESGASVVTHCHCQSCRRSVGAVAVTWATFSRAATSIRGESLRWHASSPGVLRGFCGACGSALFYTSEHYPALIDVTVGSLDQPASCPPSCHIHVLERVAWLPLAPALPCHVAGSNSPLLTQAESSG